MHISQRFNFVQVLLFTFCFLDIKRYIGHSLSWFLLGQNNFRFLLLKVLTVKELLFLIVGEKF